MLRQMLTRLRHPGRRALLIGLAALIVLLGLGGGLWLALQPRHVATVPNQGNSLLYLSASGQGNGYEDTLTMIRTSDGALLWHYQIPGQFDTGLTGQNAIQAGYAVQIVNGVIYFLVDTNPQSYPNASVHKLIALRASDGSQLWQQQIQTGLASLLSVGDGVACIETTPKKYTYTDASLTIQCYRADSGSSAWNRSTGDIAGDHLGAEFISSMNGLLYFLTGMQGARGQSTPIRIIAVQMNNGQTRWSYEDQQANGLFSFPILSEHGIVVILLTIGDLLSNSQNDREDLIGVDESSGKLLWRYQVPGFLTNGFSHQQRPFFGLGAGLDNGVFYFPSVTDKVVPPLTITSFSVTALRLADGRQLWRHTLTQGGAILLDTTLANGMLYVAYDHSDGTPRGVATDTTIAALQTSDGTQRWENRFTHLEYTALEATPDGMAALVHGPTIAELQRQDGSTRWQQTINAQEHSIIFLMRAGGKLVAAYQDTNPEGGAGTAHLCGLAPATGSTLWCHDFNTQIDAVELGP